MKRWTVLSLMLALSGLSLGAHAEGGCPQGMQPYQPPGQPWSCMPIPGYESAPAVPPPKWKSRFGAIASDLKSPTSTGAVGVSTNLTNREAAENVALEQCQANGGKGCQIETWYRNRCAVMVVGKGGYNVVNRDTLDEAIQAGMKTCTDAGGSADKADCRVFYSACSLPVRVQ